MATRVAKSNNFSANLILIGPWKTGSEIFPKVAMSRYNLIPIYNPHPLDVPVGFRNVNEFVFIWLFIVKSQLKGDSFEGKFNLV